MSSFGKGIGGIHSDVLKANPTDQDAKDRLVEELKNRAKGSLTTKNYPEAIALYSKAIELRPEDAILYSNRSMCHLGMSNASQSLEDAEKAVAFDSSYVKGYYRKGMALVGLKRYSAARDALRKGLDLAPGDKSFISQLDKLRGDEYQQDGAAVIKTPHAPKLPTKTATSSAAQPAKKEQSNSSTSTTSGKSSEVLRGYKTTSDGRKTTFFNNELDEKTKELIGDITPKAIDGTVVIEEGMLSLHKYECVRGYCVCNENYMS